MQIALDSLLIIGWQVEAVLRGFSGFAVNSGLISMPEAGSFAFGSQELIYSHNTSFTKARSSEIPSTDEFRMSFLRSNERFHLLKAAILFKQSPHHSI